MSLMWSSSLEDCFSSSSVSIIGAEAKKLNFMQQMSQGIMDIYLQTWIIMFTTQRQEYPADIHEPGSTRVASTLTATTLDLRQIQCFCICYASFMCVFYRGQEQRGGSQNSVYSILA